VPSTHVFVLPSTWVNAKSTRPTEMESHEVAPFGHAGLNLSCFAAAGVVVCTPSQVDVKLSADPPGSGATAVVSWVPRCELSKVRWPARRGSLTDDDLRVGKKVELRGRKGEVVRGEPLLAPQPGHN